MAEKKRYVLGSGDLYIMEAVELDEGGYEIPTDEEIETSEYFAGEIQGGCSITMTPTFQDVKSDMGRINDTFLTEEEVVLTSGVLEWNAYTLDKLVSTGVVTESGNKRTIRIGGLENYANTKYIIRFVHKDKRFGDLRVTICGSNTSGFEAQFTKDNPTVINCEFKATPISGDGCLVIIEESIVNAKEWTAVDSTQEGYSEMNPHALGWATKHDDEYWLTDDEEPADGVTYYELV